MNKLQKPPRFFKPHTTCVGAMNVKVELGFACSVVAKKSGGLEVKTPRFNPYIRGPRSSNPTFQLKGALKGNIGDSPDRCAMYRLDGLWHCFLF